MSQAQLSSASQAYLESSAIAETLQSLVRINSVNPAVGGPAGGEREVVEKADAFLAKLNIPATQEDVYPGRPNLMAMIEGDNPNRTLAFITHTDTVSVAGMSIDPFGGEIRDGRIWSRGATDAKGQVAAMLHAMAALAASGRKPPVNVQLVLTIDEEMGFSGVKHLVKGGYRADAVVIGEPTDLSVVVAHKGTQRWWIELAGKSAHSAKPHLGVNAIHRAASLVTEIQEIYTEELKRRQHPLLGSPTVNVSKIEGGTQVNLVPGATRLLIDRRVLPGETRASVIAEFETMFARIKAKFPDFSAKQEDALMIDPPLETAPDHPLVKTALSIAKKTGRCAQPLGVPYGTDGSKLSEVGIPTVVIGPGSIDQAHTADEFIEIQELTAGARFYFDLMLAGV